jgi:ribosomal protein S18 acetylase RimI-like enzyme
VSEPEITVSRSDSTTIEAHLRECDTRFSPSLSGRVDITDYSQKLASFAERIEAWQEGRLVGLVAAYLTNQETRRGFVSSVSVTSDFEGAGLASQLIQKCIRIARESGCEKLDLEVGAGDDRTQHFYLKHGFALSGKGRSGFLRMELNLTDQ